MEPNGNALFNRPIRMLLLVVLFLGGALTSATVARAQAPEPPPLPIIFQGTVLLDGQPVADGSLSLHVGGWRSAHVPVVDGAFRCADPCLLAGPPSADYVGKQVTFHLDDRFVSDVTFEFPNLAEPSWQEIELSFASGGIAGRSQDNSNVWLIALFGVGGLFVVVGATVFIIQRRGEDL